MTLVDTLGKYMYFKGYIITQYHGSKFNFSIMTNELFLNTNFVILLEILLYHKFY